jgi:predicted negative regulator of RcsB-dependent stress response
MKVPKALVVVIVLAAIAALGWDYYKVRQEAFCAHAYTVRQGNK